MVSVSVVLILRNNDNVYTHVNYEVVQNKWEKKTKLT